MPIVDLLVVLTAVLLVLCFVEVFFSFGLVVAQIVVAQLDGENIYFNCIFDPYPQLLVCYKGGDSIETRFRDYIMSTPCVTLNATFMFVLTFPSKILTSNRLLANLWVFQIYSHPFILEITRKYG